MKRYELVIPLSAIVGTFALTVSAAVPSFVTYSGRLTDGTGWGTSTQLDLVFTIYDAETAGERLWQQAFQDVAVADGYFSVVFGEGIDPDTSDPVLITDVFAEHDQVWLAVAVDGGLELWPRQAIGSVPYAVRATASDRVTTTSGGSRYSGNAIYRGTTANKPQVAGQGSFNANGETGGKIDFPGAATGYAAAKAACEEALDSPTAHMCTKEEIQVSAQLGVAVPTSWVIGGGGTVDYGETDFYNFDCFGFTDNSHQTSNGRMNMGFRWEQYPSRTFCDNSMPIACCDFSPDQ